MEPARQPTPTTGGDAQIDSSASDDEQAQMPLTMAASVVLNQLPKDASSALQGAGDLPESKITVRLLPVGSAPLLKQSVFRISSTQHFSAILNFIRKRVGAKEGEGVFCYVNSTFAPQPDEVVGNLWRCFRTAEELHVNYARTPAFG